MLSGPHLVLIGMGAMVLAFLFCKAVEVVKKHQTQSDPADQDDS